MNGQYLSYKSLLDRFLVYTTHFGVNFKTSLTIQAVFRINAKPAEYVHGNSANDELLTDRCDT